MLQPTYRSPDSTWLTGSSTFLSVSPNAEGKTALLLSLVVKTLYVQSRGSSQSKYKAEWRSRGCELGLLRCQVCH